MTKKLEELTEIIDGAILGRHSVAVLRDYSN